MLHPSHRPRAGRLLARLPFFAALALLLALIAGALPPGHTGQAATLPPLPAGWPATTLQLGLADGAGGAAALKASIPVGFRYQYLSAGVNTGSGWATWNPNGQFVTYYVQNSIQNGTTPVFTYYMIVQSSPGNGQGEADGVATNLNNTATMTAYFNDLKLFFQRAGAFPTTRVVLHVEPDMWAFIQQRASGDNAGTVSARVASTGLTELAGLPNTAAGLAQGIVRLRDQYAPNVLLGYHVSIWGTGADIQLSKPPDATVDALATRAGQFYLSLGAAFDLTFAEFSDRDAAFKQIQYGDGGASWMTAADFARHARFLGTFVSVAQKRLVLWQIPLGNTKMRAMNNTWGHYQDNRPEWLLDDPTRAHLDTYLQAGVIAFLFGGGAGGVTCACDAQGDGVTNPAPITGNTLVSLSADDDGGFFRQKVRDYYTAGPLALPGGGTTPPPAPTPTQPPVPTQPPTPTTPPPTTPPGATTWYFAEGFTGTGFDTYLTILNPNATAAPVAITYYLADGTTVARSLTVAAAGRATVAVHDPAQGVGRGKEVAARVTTTNAGGIVVERPIYFTYGDTVTGGHTVVGATAPRTTWWFAEGYTGPGFDEYLTILNPNPSPAPVTITYYLRGGAPVTKSLTVGPNARSTVSVHDPTYGVGRNQEVAAKVTTTLAGGVVVERPVYFTYGAGVTGGHNALGAAGPRTAWHFAEGYTGAGFDEYLTILNPNGSPAPVTVTYYLGSGGQVTKTLTVPAASRQTVAVHETTYGVGRSQEVAAKVTTTNAGGIVVERPIYFTYAGSMGDVTGGHNAVGAPSPRPLWYFAEGYTGAGFDEYLTILNPNASAAQVAITYYVRGVAPRTTTLTVPAASRRTVTVHDAAQGVGRGHEVAVAVESRNNVNIVAERPIYFRYNGGVDGGHDALGFAP